MVESPSEAMDSPDIDEDVVTVLLGKRAAVIARRRGVAAAVSEIDARMRLLGAAGGCWGLPCFAC